MPSHMYFIGGSIGEKVIELDEGQIGQREDKEHRH